ncbi:LAMI_0H10638g1_1 [Lachancea mirantina]|uniref:GPI ethanolamine phosphate transferase 2 n=1 Tax=Lachancea mirantina TaxID=1230905 RepID=A0A1G4KGW7_9SACH|nr:LAMI_0H10638g1_1 [Lachancea mirantina]
MFFRLLLLLIVQLVAILVFSVGFFPQKAVLKGNAEFWINGDEQRAMDPQFEKLVVIVIDALRSDFLFEENMSNFNFTHGLLNQGYAWGYTAYSNPPTVTLPRLKGITTGTTPNFLDAILNVAEDDSSSNLKDQDSWLKQLHIRNKRIDFFGDDTWLKLFPEEFFQRRDGTNSFFVSDFEEVDFNVTRHLPEELNTQSDWDALILHYLGLDHIGHKGGSRSQFMAPKHREMDEVIKTVFEASDEKTLVCIMGDHGMNDLGNHGGSSSGETSAGLVFASKKLVNFRKPTVQENIKVPYRNYEDNHQYLKLVNQIDFVPTIASLFNFPIPKNSIGIIIDDFLQLFNRDAASLKVQENYQQLLHISKTPDSASHDIATLFASMKEMQDSLSQSATNYNYVLIAIGYLTLLIVTLVALRIAVVKRPHFAHLAAVVVVSILLSMSTFGSSFVEEEHQFWWWIACGLVIISGFSTKNHWKSLAIVSVCLRLIRGWNNSGQKYVYERTMFSMLTARPELLWSLNAITIFVTCFDLNVRSIYSLASSFLLAGLCLTSKANLTLVSGEGLPAWLQSVVHRSCLLLVGDLPNLNKLASVPFARLFHKYLMLLLLAHFTFQRMFTGSKRSVQDINRIITAFLIFQTVPGNIPLFLVFEGMRPHLLEIMTALGSIDEFALSLTSLILQHLTFFQLGNTNSIATVNLANAYNGVSENYNIYVVGMLMCISNFAPSIYWSLWQLTTAERLGVLRISKMEHLSMLKLPEFVVYCIFGCFLLGSCIILRYHLFIWSVFSPKLCYYVTWNLFMNLIINWGLGGLVLWFS